MFNFALQPLLEFRRSLEERILLEFAGKTRQLETEKEKLDRIMQKRAFLINRFIQMQRSEMKADDVSLLFSWLNKIREDEQRQTDMVLKIAVELEGKRKELLTAVKKRKIIEVLRDRQMEEYKQNMTRKERERLDEFGIVQYAREESKEDHHRL
jgi:flagellar protein FliJ